MNNAGARWFGLLCVSRVGTALAFMMYAGALGPLIRAWAMTARQAGSIQSSFNVAYAVSLVVTSALADRLGAKRVMLWSSWVTALAAVAFALFARSYGSGLALFAVLGLAHGGTYAPAIMLVAQGVESERRGTAVGWLLAASSLGYFISIIASAAAAGRFGYRAALLLCASGSVCGLAAVAAALRSRPNLVARRAGRPSGRFLAERRSLLVTLGYTAHCWELLGMWAWTPAFLSSIFAGTKISGAGIHLSGSLASLAVGRASDRFGRKQTLVALGLVGAACSFTIGWLAHQSAAIVLPVAVLYGFAALGDSPVLSTAMTESVEAGDLGAALAVRSLLGFGAGGLAPLAFGSVLGAAHGDGWGWSFTVLGVGGALATACALLLPADARDNQR